MKVGDVVMILRDDVPGRANIGYLGMIGIVNYVFPTADYIQVASGELASQGDLQVWNVKDLEPLEASL